MSPILTIGIFSALFGIAMPLARFSHTSVLPLPPFFAVHTAVIFATVERCAVLFA
jgi:hypothetical protein